MRRDVFQAIADPTRREIIGMIAAQRLNVNAVSSRFKVSRPAIYKHIKILTECGLVQITQDGRERFCGARLAKLSAVSDWVSRYKEYWESRLDNLETYLEELQKGNKKKIKTRSSTKRK